MQFTDSIVHEKELQSKRISQGLFWTPWCTGKEKSFCFTCTFLSIFTIIAISELTPFWKFPIQWLDQKIFTGVLRWKSTGLEGYDAGARAQFTSLVFFFFVVLCGYLSVWFMRCAFPYSLYHATLNTATVLAQWVMSFDTQSSAAMPFAKNTSPPWAQVHRLAFWSAMHSLVGWSRG